MTSKEHVHHKNGIKNDNRIENLQVMTIADHQKSHKQKYPYTKIRDVCKMEFTPNPTKRLRAQVCSNECKIILHIINAAERKVEIVQYSLDGELIKEWDSARDVQNEFGK